jgi:hypothetical protein
MVTKYIDIDDKWGILLNYNFDLLDWDDIAAALYSFGMDERAINKSLHILSQYNTGMSISNDDLRMTSIYIGATTSRGQFWDTINHELLHAEQAILNYYGVDWDGEPPAYLSGYLLRRVVEEIAEPCF